MSGMNRHTGSSLSGMEHLRQSIGDILTTPIGSRVMRREYGSLVPELIDHPDNKATRVRLNAAIAGALMRWEQRLRLTSIEIERVPDVPGRVQVTLKASLNDRTRAPLTLSVPLSARSTA